MAFFETTTQSNTRLSLSEADPYLWFVPGARFAYTGSGAAIATGVADADVTIGGLLRSRDVGVAFTAPTFTRGYLTVEAGGSISARREAVTATAVNMLIVNDGLIESSEASAILVSLSSIYFSFVNNRGTISSSTGRGNAYTSFGDSADTFVNTGRIIGGIDLGDGSDLMVAGRGSSITGRVTGGTGSDAYELYEDIDIFEIGSDSDTVFAHFDYILLSGFEDLYLRGRAINGTGNDVDNFIDGNARSNRLYGSLGNDFLNDTAGGDDRLYGEEGNDTLASFGGRDLLDGGDGNDTLNFYGDGSATLNGGAGNDFLSVVADGFATINGGAGFDTLVLSRDASGATIDLTANTIVGAGMANVTFSAIENVQATDRDDVISGATTSNYLFGFDGTDTLVGLGGNDLLSGGAGADRLDGGEGSDIADYTQSNAGVRIDLTRNTAEFGNAAGDTLISIENVTGTALADRLTGSIDSNELRGLAGDDIIDGGRGGDVLVGGAGEDRLTGGASPDRFVFADVMFGAAGGWGDDVITDFLDGTDRIDFRGARGVSSIANLVITDGAGGAVITVGADTIELSFVAASALSAADFLFG